MAERLAPRVLRAVIEFTHCHKWLDPHARTRGNKFSSGYHDLVIHWISSSMRYVTQGLWKAASEKCSTSAFEVFYGVFIRQRAFAQYHQLWILLHNAEILPCLLFKQKNKKKTTK